MKAFALAVLLLGQEPSLQNGVVSGQVLGLNGQPATRVRVVAMAEPAPGAADTGFSLFESIVETDAAGRYRLADLPPGRHIIAAGLIDSLTYYPGVKTAAEARAIIVAAGETLDRIDFALANSAGVRVFGIASGAMPGIPAGMARVIMAPSEMLMIAALLTVFVGPIIWSAQLARSSGRSWLGWGIAAVMTGPIALFILYLLVRRDPQRTA